MARAFMSPWAGKWNGYDDWYNQAMNSGYYFNDDDMKYAAEDQNFANEIFGAKDDYAKATTPEAKALANARAETARGAYNYKAGVSGDNPEYFPTSAPGGTTSTTPEEPQPAVFTGTTGDWAGKMTSSFDALSNYEPFKYESPVSAQLNDSMAKLDNYEPFKYDSPYSEQITGAMSNIANYGDFTYDPYKAADPWQHSDMYANALNAVQNYQPFEYDYTSDPLYGVYKKEYTREGQRAQADALAQAAAMTGGVPSSYANTAAQQAGNYYAAQIADKIPELRQQAYNEWQGGFNNLLNRYNAAAQGDQFDYGVYSDAENRRYQQYNDQVNRDYGIYTDKYGRLLNNLDMYQNADNTAYNRALDQWDMGYGQRNDQYNRYRDVDTTEYGRALDQWNMGHDQQRELYDLSRGNYRDELADSIAADERAYNRAWNENERDYNRSWDERAYQDERNDLAYDREKNEDATKWSRALTAMEYGDSSQLAALGVDVSKYVADQAYQDQVNRAVQAAQYGDYSQLEALGIDVSYMERTRDAELAELDKPELTLSQVLSELSNGNTAPNVLSAWKYYMGSDYNGEYAPVEPASTGSGSGSVKPTTGGLVAPSADWARIYNESNADPNAARTNLYNYWDILSESQRNILARLGGVEKEQLDDLGGATKVGKEAFGSYASLLTPPEEEEDKLATDIQSNVKDEKSATSYLQNHGNTAIPLTQEQWALSAQKSRFNTYQDYLYAFVYEHLS